MSPHRFSLHINASTGPMERQENLEGRFTHLSPTW